MRSEKKGIVDMVYDCKEKGFISNDAAHLFHVIRKQRNLFAHNAIDHQTRLMRVLFVVAAFSILSKEL